jgi:putative phosphoesterase
VRVVVLADTHLRRGSKRGLPPLASAELEAADAILHAGDIVVGDVLEDLRRYAPTHAVLGNNDHELRGALPEALTLDMAGVSVAMVHDSGPAKGREGRLHRRFPGADVVVFGHSHIPVDAAGVGGQRLFNPGSPTQRRLQPHHTVGVLDLRDGQVVGHGIVVVGP